MDISVDLPAPFSPMMPWIVPGITRIEMSRLACTAPNAFEIPLSSMAGASVMARPSWGRGPRRGPSEADQ